VLFEGTSKLLEQENGVSLEKTAGFPALPLGKQIFIFSAGFQASLFAPVLSQ
jgi:hypothetical protein